MMKKNIISIYTMLLALAVITFMACEKDSTFPDRDDPVENQARIRFYNASPNAKPVNVWVNGQKVNGTAVSYYTAFPGEYFVVQPGAASLKVLDTASNNPAQYFEVSQTLDASKHYSFFAIDSFAKLKPLFIEDKITQPAAGMANIRFLNLSPNSTGADIMIMKFNNISLATPDTLVKGLPFGGINDFRSLPVGVYDFKVNSRTSGAATGTFTVTASSLVQGGQYTFVARGFTGATTGTGAYTATVSSYRPTY